MSFLIDTNVISEARRPSGSSRVKAWLASIPPVDVYLSVLVIGEIRRGIERLRPRDPAQAHAYEVWLAQLRRDYADRILPITAEIADVWGRMNVPDPLPTVDGLLAATAQVEGMIIATRNTADFVRTGVRLVNPFEPTNSVNHDGHQPRSQ